MRGEKYTPFGKWDSQKASRERIGVPGGKIYNYDSDVIFMWTGSALREVVLSRIFYIHLAILLFMIVCFTAGGYPSSVRAMKISSGWTGSTLSLCVFTLTFFLSNVFG